MKGEWNYAIYLFIFSSHIFFNLIFWFFYCFFYACTFADNYRMTLDPNIVEDVNRDETDA